MRTRTADGEGVERCLTSAHTTESSGLAAWFEPTSQVVTIAVVNIEEFEAEVEVVLSHLPAWVKETMDNVYVVVERRPTKAQDPTGDGLLGLYEGVSLDERGFDYFGVAPDSIFVFYEPHVALGLTGQDLRDEIRTTVLHELGHHLGMTDDRLHELGWA